MDGLASAGSFVPAGGRGSAGWLDGDSFITGTGLFHQNGIADFGKRGQKLWKRCFWADDSFTFRVICVIMPNRYGNTGMRFRNFDKYRGETAQRRIRGRGFVLYSRV